jgi:hypothetical protein
MHSKFAGGCSGDRFIVTVNLRRSSGVVTRFVTRDARCNSVMQTSILLDQSKSSGP